MNIDIALFTNTALKIISIVGLVVYAFFALVMVRQERLMANVIEETFEPVVRIIVLLHFVASIFLLLMAFLLL